MKPSRKPVRRDIAPAIRELLLESEKFLNWKPDPEATLDDLTNSHIMAEKHYTPDDLASLWGVSAETVRNIFRKEPGVLRVTQPNEKKRKYVLTRIPHSVAERVHKRLSAVPA
jgi:hypothetical protein